jgi:ATP-binding cassette, subfamily C, bacterial CydC
VNVAWLIGLTLRHPWRLAAAVLAAVATVVAGVGLMASSGYLISRAALRPPILELTVVLVGVRFFGISRAGLRYVERLVSHDLTFKILLELRGWFYDRLEPLAPGRVSGWRSGDLLGRIVGDVERLQNVYLRVVAPVLVALIAVALTCGWLAWFNVTLALVTAGFLGMNGIVVPWLVRVWSRGYGRRQVKLRGELNAYLVDRIQGVQDVLAFGMEGSAARRVAELNGALESLQRRQASVTGLHEGLSHGCAWLGTATVLWLSVPLVLDGSLGGVLLAMLALAVLSSFEAVQNLGVAFQHHEASEAAAARLFEVLDPTRAIADVQGWDSMPMPGSSEVSFEHVFFRYGTEGTIKDVDFRIDQGRRIAVVGASGAGKSTLIHLMLRFQEVEGGRILLGGTDIRRLDEESLRNRFAVVAQDAHVFNTTLRHNLRIAQADATDGEMVGALELAGLGAWLNSAPEGLDAPCGNRGGRLSGGERRRLAMAQALLRDAPIVLLDEPLANLDGANETLIMETIASKWHGRSVFMVTHRLLRMEWWDEILVLRAGSIAERGTHLELMRRGGYYRRILEVQEGWLRDTGSDNSSGARDGHR